MKEQTRKMNDSLGAGGSCVCPKCTTIIRHKAGIPCQDEKCPKCGSKMLRIGSYHHQLWEEKQN